MKVRLKLVATVARCTLCFGFNSMKVRLKQQESYTQFLCSMFQFHEGPIKTVFLVSSLVPKRVSIP